MEDLCYIIGYYIYVQLHVRTSKEINKFIMEDLKKNVYNASLDC